MQKIRFAKKQDKDIIYIEDVVEDSNKIYCCDDGDDIRFLFQPKDRQFYWARLHLPSALPNYEYHTTFLKAIHAVRDVLIFENIAELADYMKKWKP